MGTIGLIGSSMNTEEALTKILPTFDSAFKPKKIVIVGNGAVINGWNPLKKLIRKGMANSKKYFEITMSDFPTESLCTTAFLNRIFRHSLVRHLNGNGSKVIRSSKKLMEDLISYRENRIAVGEAYAEAVTCGCISLRGEIKFVKEVVNPIEDAIITTNWDDLLVKSGLTKNIIHLHGRAVEPDSIILPTEMSCDDWIFSEHTSLVTDLKNEAIKYGVNVAKLTSAFTRDHHCRNNETSHHTAMKWLDGAEEVIVWGLGTHHYDAELRSVLSTVNARSSPPKLSLVDSQETRKNDIGHLFGVSPKDIFFKKANTLRSQIFEYLWQREHYSLCKAAEKCRKYS